MAKLTRGSMLMQNRYGGAIVYVCADLPTFAQATIERRFPTTLKDGDALADFMVELFAEFNPEEEVVALFDDGSGPYKLLLAEAEQRQTTEDHGWKQTSLVNGTLHVMQNKLFWKGE